MGNTKKYIPTQSHSSEHVTHVSYRSLTSNQIIAATMKNFAALTALISLVISIVGNVFTPQVAQAVTRLSQAAVQQSSGLRGLVWNDANHDGIRQTTEHGFPGITVTLYVGRVQVVTSTLTSATGEYTFTNLEPLSYTVGFALPKDYSFTVPSSDSDVNASGLSDVSLSPGDEVANIDAGIWRSALVSDDPPTTELHSIFLPMVSNGR
jgi:SdrD B-like domain